MSIILFINEMDKFEQTGMKTVRPFKITWYDYIITCIHKPIKKVLVVSKIKLHVFSRQTHLNKPCMREEKN